MSCIHEVTFPSIAARDGRFAIFAQIAACRRGRKQKPENACRKEVISNPRAISHGEMAERRQMTDGWTEEQP
mgnify:CR=1 FL=1